MELSKEVRKAKQQVEDMKNGLIELRGALENILVFDRGPIVDENKDCNSCKMSCGLPYYGRTFFFLCTAG